MDAIAPDHGAARPWTPVMAFIAAELARRGAHAARTVVLVPYAQLMQVGRDAWARAHPSGFSPRFETTMNWAGQAGFTPGADDISFDMGRDLLTARAWLDSAGLGAQAGLLAGRLVEAARQLATLAQAVPPPERAAWAVRARAAAAAGAEAQVLQIEAALGRIAVEWAAASSYAGDVLLRPALAQEIDLLVVLRGFDADPMAQALLDMLGDQAVAFDLPQDAPAGSILMRRAADPSHEAEMAAACVVAHIDAGRQPVALAAIDRVLTRRVRAMLGDRGIAIRDETGWKLSTTRAAAHVMGALRACAWDAGSDAVLDWLKNAPHAAPRTVSALERRVRREGLRDWRSVAALPPKDDARWQALVEKADEWRALLAGTKPLAQWLQALRDLLVVSGRWDWMASDAAGMQVVEALGLEAQAQWQQLPQAARRGNLAEFTAWVNEVLEAGSFQPPKPREAQVVILPFNQLLGREAAALVLAGCDEVRLPASPEPPGPWTAAQRLALGLPAREALEQAQRAGWRNALQAPHCDVLWRTSDDSGEPVLASSLVQQLRLDGLAQVAEDPRAARPVTPAPVSMPAPTAVQLPLAQLSASAYEDLRKCPYRFFALRQLGLQEASEIDADLDKRDFGIWLHSVLGTFHLALQNSPTPPGPLRAQLLETTAQEVTRQQGLDDGEFLPFAAAWPQVRDGYLAWLAGHEAQGAVFGTAESEHEMRLGPIKLVGRIDRIDSLPGGETLVMDYKTEARGTTADRIRNPVEDTQLAFYAALLEQDTLRAAYVNVGERGKTERLEQPEVVEARDLLVEGILHDLEQVQGGAPLPALGEGMGCEFCSARGLCRKDAWA